MSPRLPLATLAAPLFVGASLAQVPDVAIVAAAGPSLADCRYTSVVDELVATGDFGAVDVLDCVSSTPTLAELAAYDAVLSWSEIAFFDAAALGDVMADYVDMGGAVVLGVLAHPGPDGRLGGRWEQGSYDIWPATAGVVSGPASATALVSPLSISLTFGFSSFSVSGAPRRASPSGGWAGGSSTLIWWSDGHPVAVTGPNRRRIDLGLLPVPAPCEAASFAPFAGGGALIARALLVTALADRVISATYCPGAIGTLGVPHELTVYGSDVAAQNFVRLRVEPMPNNVFGFFITSRTRDFVPHAGTTSSHNMLGTLCLGGSIGRYVGPLQIQNTQTDGHMSLQLDLSRHPTPTGPIQVLAGETWNFQLWHRAGCCHGIATSNMSSAAEVLFR